MLLWISATVASRMFESEYVEKVYGKRERPPNLINMVLILGTSLIVFNVLLMAGMIILTSDFQGTESVFSKKNIQIV